MRRGAGWLLLLPAPAFAMSAALSSLLPTLAVLAAQIAGMVFLYYVAIAGVKMLYLNFFSPEAIDMGMSFDKFSPVAGSVKWDKIEIDTGINSSKRTDDYSDSEVDRFSDDLPEIDWHFDKA